MKVVQVTHDYHPLTKVTQLWAEFRQAMIDKATAPEGERDDKRREEIHDSQRIDARTAG